MHEVMLIFHASALLALTVSLIMLARRLLELHKEMVASRSIFRANHCSNGPSRATDDGTSMATSISEAQSPAGE